MADDDDEGNFGGAYEEGHWTWDETLKELSFVSDLPPQQIEAVTVSLKVPTGTVEFRDDVDLIEQIRFRKRYQRKLAHGQADVITVQDVKDLALFTAPLNILSSTLINMLHLSTTERFIRALILYCQYYLQIANEMSRRMAELQTRVRTPDCEIIEAVFRDNLCDLRTLVTKEYSTMLIGGSDTKKFHHMGPTKKRRSLSDKDARLMETLLRVCIQIVWLALSRRSFNQIELEVNRLFKSEIFNSVEHTLRTDYINKMSREERSVLLGGCVRHDQKLNTRSPLINEVFCQRPIDYRMMGLGVIKTEESRMTPRLKYLYLAIAGPEEELLNLGVTIGILGLPRSYFDTTLHVLPTIADEGKKGKSQGSVVGGMAHSGSMRSAGFDKRHSGASPVPQSCASSGKSVGSSGKKAAAEKRIYQDIHLPSKELEEPEFPPSFPDEPEAPRTCSERQRRRWQNRLLRLLHPHKYSSRKSMLS